MCATTKPVMQRFSERFSFLLDFFPGADRFRVWHRAALGDSAPEETPFIYF
jgi:hypothetical protein